MILCNDLEDDFAGPVTLRPYPPYWLDKSSGIKNPNRDDNTIYIMDLKAMKEWHVRDTVKELDGNIEKGIVIAVVPSHDPAKQASGIRMVAERLAALGRIDGTGCLVRHTWVPKKSDGGSRQISVDLSSIKVINRKIIAGENILLLDDVTSTGGSLEACKQLLEDAGAENVQTLAIGKTVH